NCDHLGAPAQRHREGRDVFKDDVGYDSEKLIQSEQRLVGIRPTPVRRYGADPLRRGMLRRIAISLAGTLVLVVGWPRQEIGALHGGREPCKSTHTSYGTPGPNPN